MEKDKLIEQIASKLENIFDNGNYFKDNFNQLSKDVQQDINLEVFDYALTEGFPLVMEEEVNKLNYDLQFSSSESFETNAHIFYGDNRLDDMNEEEQEAVLNDDDKFKEYIENNLGYTLEITLKTDLVDFLERYPTHQYAADIIEEKYEYNELNNYLKENPEHIRQAIEDTLENEGFPKDVDINTIDYNVRANDEIALDHLVDTCVITVFESEDDSLTTSKWLDDNMYVFLANDIEENDQDNVEIEILTDLADLDE